MLDDFSDLEVSSFAMHEWFLTLLRSGFSEEQALKMISYTISNMNSGDDDEG